MALAESASTQDLTPPEKVVVALDASRGSLAALRAAAELASMLDGGIWKDCL